MPTAPEHLWSYVEKLSERDINRITHENAMRHFHNDPFAVIPREEATVRALRARAAGRDVAAHSTRKGAQMPMATRAADLGAFAGQR